MGRQQPNKYVISKLRSKKNRRQGRGKLMSYRLPFRLSFRKSTTSTRKKEVPQSTIDVLPSSSLKKGKKTHIKKKVVLDPESKAWQDICHPNKKVVFTKGSVPSFEYLQYINKAGSLGCDINTFPKYENGKYCCMTEPSSKQEQLDFINSLLEAAMNNVSDTAFIKQRSNILLLLRQRKLLLNDYRLIDNLEVIEPYESITDWFKQTEERAGNEISRNRPDPVVDDDPIHMRIQNEVAQNRKKNQEYTLGLKSMREKKEKLAQTRKARLDLWKARATALANNARTLLSKNMRTGSVK